MDESDPSALVAYLHTERERARAARRSDLPGHQYGFLTGRIAALEDVAAIAGYPFPDRVTRPADHRWWHDISAPD